MFLYVIEIILGLYNIDDLFNMYENCMKYVYSVLWGILELGVISCAKRFKCDLIKLWQSVLQSGSQHWVLTPYSA